MRDAILLAEPAARVDVEELCSPAGTLLQLGGQRREQLQARRSELRPSPSSAAGPTKSASASAVSSPVSFVR